jgi:hypothetical protein
MSSSDQPPKDEADALVKAIGNATVIWSWFDHALTMTLAEILSLTEVQERILIRPMLPRAKSDLLQRLAKEYVHAERQSITDFLEKEIKPAIDTRNELMHSLYVAKDGKALQLSFSGKFRIKGQVTPLDAKGLGLFVFEVRYLTEKLPRIRRLFPATLPDKAPELSAQPRDDDVGK